MLFYLILLVEDFVYEVLWRGFLCLHGLYSRFAVSLLSNCHPNWPKPDGRHLLSEGRMSEHYFSKWADSCWIFSCYDDVCFLTHRDCGNLDSKYLEKNGPSCPNLTGLKLCKIMQGWIMQPWGDCPFHECINDSRSNHHLCPQTEV